MSNKENALENIVYHKWYIKKVVTTICIDHTRVIHKETETKSRLQCV